MNKLALAGAIMGIGTGTFYATSRYSVSVPRISDIPVSVVMPVKNEDPSLVSLSLSSILKQLPDGSEVILVTDDDYVANDSRVRVVYSPVGKLNARNIGTENAINDIIVAVDADTYYPPGWLYMVLEPFKDPEVVGVTTPSNFFGNPLLDMWLYPAYVYVLSRKMSGRSSAYRKWAWEVTGKFDSSKETDLRSLMQEEEVNFMLRLQTVGKVVFVNAPCEHLGGFGTGRGLRTHLLS